MTLMILLMISMTLNDTNDIKNNVASESRTLEGTFIRITNQLRARLPTLLKNLLLEKISGISHCGVTI